MPVGDQPTGRVDPLKPPVDGAPQAESLAAKVAGRRLVAEAHRLQVAESLAAEVAGRRLVAGNRLCAVSPPRLVQLQACII